MNNPAHDELLAQTKAALSNKDRRAINLAIIALLDSDIRLGKTWKSLAIAASRNGELGLAMRAVERMTDDLPPSPGLFLEQAAFFAQAGRLDTAAKLVGLIPSNSPAAADRDYLLGTIALNRNDRALARTHLTRAVEQRPNSGQAWLALSEVTDFLGDGRLCDRLESAWASSSASPLERANLGYAVGRKRHQIGEYQGAFDAFAEGAQARLTARPQNEQAEIAGIQAALGWDSELIQRTAARITIDHRRPIFVTGMPRSGTTLVEQILVSHKDVAQGAELSLFHILAQDIGGLEARDLAAWLDRGGDPNELVRTYLALASGRFGNDGRFVDKSLQASRYMGLLLALFPDAPIIWLRRDPIDCGWSAFRTFFVRGLDWSWSLESVGRELAREDRLYDYWSTQFPDRITIVDYEQLVGDPVSQIERLSVAAGLTLDPAMLAPHETERVVTTASTSQVRKPINLDGIGAARPYHQWIGPMMEAYAQAGADRR